MSAERSRSRAALGRSARWTSYVLAGLIATIVAVVLALATTPGRDVLANLIQRAVRVSGITVAITNISGWPPFHFGVEKVVVHDIDGPFVEIDKLEGRLRFTDLFNAVVSLASHGAGHRPISLYAHATPRGACRRMCS
jgi:autotransporter translocation and assembly factor TamB